MKHAGITQQHGIEAPKRHETAWRVAGASRSKSDRLPTGLCIFIWLAIDAAILCALYALWSFIA